MIVYSPVNRVANEVAQKFVQMARSLAGRVAGWFFLRNHRYVRCNSRQHRFILANTEQLHDKIKTMSERIRLLEEGLQAVNSQVSQNEHPLLRPDLLTIKKSAELFGIDQQVMTHDSAPEASQKQDDIARPPSTTGSSRDDDEVLSDCFNILA